MSVGWMYVYRCCGSSVFSAIVMVALNRNFLIITNVKSCRCSVL